MAKNEIGNIELKFDVTGLEDLTSLSRGLKNLKQSIQPVKGRFKGLAQAIGDITKFTPKTISQFRKKERVLKSLREEVRAGGRGFSILGKEIDKNREKLQAFTKTAKKGKGFFGGLGAGGTAAIGGAGAYIGSTLGLPPAMTGLASMGAASAKATGGSAIGGAMAGAGIGAAVTLAAGTVNFVNEAATYASEIQKLEIALAGVTGTQEEFEYGLEVIARTSRELNVPIAASTKQFTTLAASVLGAGGTIEDAETVFTGVSNAIKATGGNAEDVQSAIRAMSQIFGKGKVSAEELQGQLGERLAGAVVKFAEANGSSLEKLQKDLRDGTVGLDQIMTFAEKLNEDFAATAKQVANSSADAGQRLQTSMNLFKLAVGKTVLPIGAAFQKAFSDITLGILQSEEAMGFITGTLKVLGGALYATFAAVRFLTRSLVDMAKILYHIANLEFKKAFDVMKKGFKDTAETAKKDFQALGEIVIEPPKIKAKGKKGNRTGLASLGEGDNSPLKSFADSAFKFAAQAEQAVVNAFQGMEDALVKFVTQGKLNFADLARSIIADITRIVIRATIIKPLMGIFGLANGGVVSKGKIDPTYGTGIPSNPSSVFGSVNAKGNVFAQNKIVPYKMGGIVDSPHIFPMQNGMGLMGEAGPEGVLPLKRGRDGKLGVIANGGGVGNIVVNVDASGSSVQGDSARSEEFGRALAGAIQSEIVQQQRPGGLLA